MPQDDGWVRDEPLEGATDGGSQYGVGGAGEEERRSESEEVPFHPGFGRASVDDALIESFEDLDAEPSNYSDPLVAQQRERVEARAANAHWLAHEATPQEVLLHNEFGAVPDDVLRRARDALAGAGSR